MLTQPETRGRPTVPRVRGAQRPHVVLAEDDPDLRRLMIDQLISDGYEVTACEDGGELLDFVRARLADEPPSDVPDLIVTDVRMPVWSGADALEMLRLQGWRVPVVLVTAFPDAQTARLARRHDAWVLAKPFDFDLLSAVVLEALTRRKTA